MPSSAAHLQLGYEVILEPLRPLRAVLWWVGWRRSRRWQWHVSVGHNNFAQCCGGCWLVQSIVLWPAHRLCVVLLTWSQGCQGKFRGALCWSIRLRHGFCWGGARARSRPNHFSTVSRVSRLATPEPAQHRLALSPSPRLPFRPKRPKKHPTLLRIAFSLLPALSPTPFPPLPPLPPLLCACPPALSCRRAITHSPGDERTRIQIFGALPLTNPPHQRFSHPVGPSNSPLISILSSLR